MPVFGNPLGLLALLGIPAVLAIHFLQRKAREMPVATLFLLDPTRREASQGRRFERLVPSIPLWMQLLAVCILAWFLADPRYPRENSVQRIAVVLDSSASMSVFKPQVIEALNTTIPQLQGKAAGIQLTVLEAAAERPPVFTGQTTDGLAAAIDRWQPRDGPLDPTQALRLARSLVATDGSVIHLTDTPDTAEPPFGAIRIAVGEAIDNVGFTGVTIETIEGALVCKALVRNHGANEATRTWSLQTASGGSTPRPLRIAPGALVTVQTAFPTGQERVRLVLSADRFPMDDVLPLVAPRPKPLVVRNAVPPAFLNLAERLVKSLDATSLAGAAEPADFTIAAYNPLDPVLPAGPAIIFTEDETRTGAWLKGGIVAEIHPLMDGINWQSLLVRETISLTPAPADRILLRQDQRPLILLRESPDARQLIFNFDPGLSNVEKQPAFIVLLHRFAESIRAGKVAPVAANLETGQPLQIARRPAPTLAITAIDPEGGPLPFPADPEARRAIPVPGFMRVTQGDLTLLDAAVYFGDPREADFRKCGSAVPAAATGTAAIERHTRPDPLWRVWIAVLLAALLVAWRFTAPKTLPA